MYERQHGLDQNAGQEEQGAAAYSGTVVRAVDELKEYVGKEVRVSPWIEMTQERVNQFAEATGDFQYIHVDPERAKETFFGGTIAHGYLTLSLSFGSGPGSEGITVDLGAKLAVNYGLNSVRFTAPVPVGKRIRQRVLLKSVEEIGEQAVQLTHTRTIEVEGGEKPACIAESLTRYYF